ncbi:hypothetical protein E2562_017038 [Oryza meyeriana var. granulata]|uniref:Uncharacterized protein n=1 Tax=Oryza meyeriana var. granulata TaxID=110450 RepID=A0A6G1F8Q0_9ORYZ|nr:hypothetical protein E2562_017038 [Oryza meyeriana var. granulata]
MPCRGSRSGEHVTINLVNSDDEQKLGEDFSQVFNDPEELENFRKGVHSFQENRKNEVNTTANGQFFFLVAQPEEGQQSSTGWVGEDDLVLLSSQSYVASIGNLLQARIIKMQCLLQC